MYICKDFFLNTIKYNEKKFLSLKLLFLNSSTYKENKKNIISAMELQSKVLEESKQICISFPFLYPHSVVRPHTF